MRLHFYQSFPYSLKHKFRLTELHIGQYKVHVSRVSRSILCLQEVAVYLERNISHWLSHRET